MTGCLPVPGPREGHGWISVSICMPSSHDTLNVEAPPSWAPQGFISGCVLKEFPRLLGMESAEHQPCYLSLENLEHVSKPSLAYKFPYVLNPHSEFYFQQVHPVRSEGSWQQQVVSDKGEVQTFDRVVFACPSHAVANVLRPPGRREPTTHPCS